MRRRPGRSLVAAVAAVATCTLVVAAPATASPRTDGSGSPTVTAYASADYPSSGKLSPQVYVGGLLGSLLAPLVNPVLNGLVNPLLSAVANLPQQLVTSVANAINASGLSASNPVPAPAPSTTFTDCKSAGLGSSSCFDLYSFKVPTNPLISVAADQTAGWTVTDTSSGANEVRAESHTSAFKLNLLGIPILQTANSVAQANCPTVLGQTASATSTLSNVQILGGLISAAQADSLLGWLNISAFNQTLTSVNQIVAGTYQGSPVSIQLTSNGLWLTLAFEPYQLLDMLGLNVVSSLVQLIVPGLNVKLQVFMGPGQTSDGTNYAYAWGDSFGIDLSADFEIGIAGLATIGFKIPTGIVMNNGNPTGGNLLGLKVAYAACTTSNPQPASAIPPGVN